MPWRGSATDARPAPSEMKEEIVRQSGPVSGAEFVFIIYVIVTS